jgi:tetratricopeptide (TPR) repeat protein
MGQYKESLIYLKKIVEQFETLNESNTSVQGIGYVYWQNGNLKEADRRFNKQKRMGEESIKLGREYSTDGFANYDLAAVYAFLGNKEKAYENLRDFAKIHICPWWVLNNIKTDPFFDSIRNEPDFQKIVNILEAKYQTEHEKVRKWLEEQGEL